MTYTPEHQITQEESAAYYTVGCEPTEKCVHASCMEVIDDGLISLWDRQISVKLVQCYSQINELLKCYTWSWVLTFVSWWVNLPIHQHVGIGRTVTATNCSTRYNTKCWQLSES